MPFKQKSQTPLTRKKANKKPFNHRPFLLWGEMERSSKPYMQFLATLLNMVRESNQTLIRAETLLKHRVLNILLPTEADGLIIGQNSFDFLSLIYIIPLFNFF